MPTLRIPGDRQPVGGRGTPGVDDEEIRELVGGTRPGRPGEDERVRAHARPHARPRCRRPRPRQGDGQGDSDGRDQGAPSYGTAVHVVVIVNGPFWSVDELGPSITSASSDDCPAAAAQLPALLTTVKAVSHVGVDVTEV